MMWGKMQSSAGEVVFHNEVPEQFKRHLLDAYECGYANDGNNHFVLQCIEINGYKVLLFIADINVPVTLNLHNQTSTKGLYFNIEGNSIVTDNADQPIFQGQFMMVNPINNKLHFRYPKTGIYQHFFIQIDKKHINKLATYFDFVKELNQPKAKNTPYFISLAILTTLQQLLDNKIPQRLYKYYALIKTAELVLLSLMHIENVDARPAKPINEAVLEKIATAKSIVLQSINADISLKNLSKRIGMNEHDVKHYFKLVHGMTVFSFLRKERMEEAAKLLLDKTNTVQSVAYSVGYNNVAAFITAFKKYFGQIPGSFKKNQQ